MGAIILWRPKNVFDWVFLANIPITLAFFISLKRIEGQYSTIQLMFGIAIAILCLRRSKQLETKKEMKRLIEGDINGN